MLIFKDKSFFKQYSKSQVSTFLGKREYSTFVPALGLTVNSDKISNMFSINPWFVTGLTDAEGSFSCIN